VVWRESRPKKDAKLRVTSLASCAFPYHQAGQATREQTSSSEHACISSCDLAEREQSRAGWPLCDDVRRRGEGIKERGESYKSYVRDGECDSLLLPPFGLYTWGHGTPPVDLFTVYLNQLSISVSVARIGCVLGWQREGEGVVWRRCGLENGLRGRAAMATATVGQRTVAFGLTRALSLSSPWKWNGMEPRLLLLRQIPYTPTWHSCFFRQEKRKGIMSAVCN
jgi:hypothetical protein